MPRNPFIDVAAEAEDEQNSAAATDPFDDPPPSVRQAKAESGKDPFQDDPELVENRQRLRDLDQQIQGRPTSIAGILAGFSPHGDRQLQNLMAQRQQAGNEYHYNAQMKSALARQNAMYEQALARANATIEAANARARGMTGAAEINSGSRERVAAGNNATSLTNTQTRANRPFPVAAGASVYDPSTGTNGPQNSFRPPAPAAAARAAAAPKDARVPVLQAELKQLYKQFNDPNTPDDQKLRLMVSYNAKKRELTQLAGDAAPAAAAPAAPAAPAVKRPTATGPNGEKVEWDGTNWVPVS